MVSWYTLAVQYQEDKTQIKEVVKSGKVWFLCIIMIYILLVENNTLIYHVLYVHHKVAVFMICIPPSRFL